MIGRIRFRIWLGIPTWSQNVRDFQCFYCLNAFKALRSELREREFQMIFFNFISFTRHKSYGNVLIYWKLKINFKIQLSNLKSKPRPWHSMDQLNLTFFDQLDQRSNSNNQGCRYARKKNKHGVLNYHRLT